MDIEIDACLQKPTIPQDNRRVFVSFLKRAFQQVDPSLYIRLYESGPVYKPFAFAVWLPDPHHLGSVIQLEKPELRITYRTGNPSLGISLYNAMLQMKGKAFPLAGQNTMSVTRVRIHNSREITQRQVAIKFLSPLVCRLHRPDKPDRYFTSEEEGFAEVLQQDATMLLTRLAGLAPEQCVIKLKPIHARRTVVRAFGCAFGCTLGHFLLEGSLEALNALYVYGIGSRRSEGFGLFHLSGE